MFAESFLGLPRCGHCPDRLHLFTRHRLHRLVIEDVFASLVLGGPENRFGRVRKIPTRQIRRRIGFFPGDVIENLEPELLHGVANTENDVVRAGHPDRAVRLENTLTALQPFRVEFVIQLRPARLVPFAFVDLHHLSRVARNATIG